MAQVITRNAFDLLDLDAPLPTKPTKAPKPEPVKPAPKKEKEIIRPTSARGGKGRGRGRGGRGRGDVRGKREFDHHVSGTGRDRRAKKEGAGKYNWGVDGEEGEDKRRPRRTDRKPADEKAEDGEEDKAEADGEKVAEKKAPEPEPEEEEDNSVSYAEYLANKADVDEDVNRQVREVEIDESQFKSSAVVEKEEETCEYIIEGGKKGPRKKNRKKAGKISLDEFAAPAAAAPKSNYRGDRGDSRGQSRGGKGRGKGGKGDSRGKGESRGKGGGKGGRGRNFDLAKNAFPALGGK